MKCKMCNKREVITKSNNETYTGCRSIALRKPIDKDHYQFLRIGITFPKEAPLCGQCQWETLRDAASDILCTNEKFQDIQDMPFTEREGLVFGCLSPNSDVIVVEGKIK